MECEAETPPALAAAYASNPPTHWSPGETVSYAVTVTNCGAVVVDSSDPEAIFLAGNAVVTATEADVGIGGGAVTHGNATLNLLEPEFNQEAATPDPFALPLPAAPATHFAAVHASGHDTLSLSPGTYDGGIEVTGHASVTLAAGVYYMNGGGFKVSGHGSVTGTGVIIVNAPTRSSDTISVTGQGIVSLTAKTDLTGALASYNGIALMQAPASANTVAQALRKPWAEQCGRLACRHQCLNFSPNPFVVNDLPYSVTRKVMWPDGAATMLVSSCGWVGISISIGLRWSFLAWRN